VSNVLQLHVEFEEHQLCVFNVVHLKFPFECETRVPPCLFKL